MTAIDKVRTWCGIGTAEQAILELSDTIKALTENIEGQELRLTDLENLVDQHLRPQLREQPLTFGISNSGPVLNDGKAEPDLSQRPPFVTGLPVLDSLKK